MKNHKELCNAWVAQKHGHGKASNLRFEGASLFSYRTIIGHIYTNEHGKLAVIYTSRHSPSTHRHQDAARGACVRANHPYIEADLESGRGTKFFPPPEQMLLAMLEGAARQFMLSERRGRWKDWHAERGEKVFQNMKKLAVFFNLPKPDLADVFVRSNELLDESAKGRAESRASNAAWSRGESDYLHRSHSLPIRLMDGCVEVRNLAPIPLEEARVVVLQWMCDKAFMRNWTWVEERAWGRAFGKRVTRLGAKTGAPAAVGRLLHIGPEKCINWFLKQGIISAE